MILAGVYAVYGCLASPPAGHPEMLGPLNATALLCFLGGEIVLLVRIDAEIVQLLSAVAQVVDVLPVLFAQPQRVLALGDVDTLDDFARRRNGSLGQL